MKLLPHPLDSHATASPGNAVDVSGVQVTDDQKRRWREAIDEHIAHRINDLPMPASDYFAQSERTRAKLIRYFSYPDETPSKKLVQDFARLWSIRDEFLRPHEITIVEDALRDDNSYGNVVRHLDWLAHMYDRRVGGY